MISRSVRIYLAVTLIILFATLTSSIKGQTLPTVYPNVVWSPDNTKIAVGSNSGVSLYTKALQPTMTLDPSIPMYSVQWSPDGSKLLGSGTNGIVKIWDVLTGKIIDTFQIGIQTYSSVAWEPNGNKIAAGGYDQTLRIWDTATKLQIETITAQDQIIVVKWSPNGKYIAIAGGHYDSNSNPSSFVQIVDTSSWQVTKTLNSTPLYEPVLELSWNQFSTQLAITAVTPFIWDISTEQVIATFEEHLGNVFSINWSSAQNAVVSASVSLTSMYAWNPATGAVIKEFDVEDHVINVVWSPNGDYVAGASIDGKIILWAATGRKLKCVQLPKGQRSLTDIFSTQPTSC